MSETHYRKVFDSPYLSSADLVDPITLTIDHVAQELDRTKKTKDLFNTAHFREKEIRPGEKLKPMILNATNSKELAALSGTPFIEHWSDIRVQVRVMKNIKFGRDVVDGLRMGPAPSRKTITPGSQMWENAKKAYLRDGNLMKVLAAADMTDEHQLQLIDEASA